MNEPYLRLLEARRKAGFETASDAARAFGWNENTYRSHENGERGLRPGVAAKYAKAFRVLSSWLLYGHSGKGSEIFVDEKNPVFLIRDDGVKRKLDDGTSFYIDGISIYTSVEKYYLLVDTEKLYPLFDKGDLILTTIAREETTVYGSRYYFFSTEEGNHYFGDFAVFRDEVVIKTYTGDLIPAEGLMNTNIIMCVLKRPFYELRSEAT